MASCSSPFPISSSISSTSQWKYDVFLSFRGEDTRNTAVDIVNNALQWRGIYTFKDDEKLEKGKTIKTELFKAIEESRFAVVILSKNYASSTWCLDELVKIVDCEKEKGLTIIPVFYDVDPSDLRKLKGAFANAFNEHEKQFKGKVVRTWRAALNHVADIGGYHIKNSPLSEAVKCIVRQVSRKSCPEFSEITEGLVGIHSRLAELESCLARWSKDDVRSVGLWAMGGMGKSTLAKVAYEMISKEFDYCCFIKEVWKQDLFSLQEYFISQILHVKDSNIQNDLNGELKIKKMLRDKKVLLVLDDVDESNKLGKLVKSDWFGSGSRIIITTREKRLLDEFSVDEIFEVKALNYNDALCLFCSKAFKKEQCPEEYFEPLKSFLEYVNGLPLALEVLGSFLFEKSTEEWKSALKMLKEVPDPGIDRVLKISVDGLHESVKDIFKDIACFFNHEEKDHVVRTLDSIGRHSNIGLRILIDRSLLKIFKNSELWMHNLIEDMGRNMVRQESPEPGERSRLWLYKDIDHVLKNNTGTGKVEAIDIKGAKDTNIYHEEKEACWRPQGLAPLVTLQGWVRSALSWQGLALLVTLLGWVQRTLSWKGFTSLERPEGLLWNPNAFLKMPNLKFLRIRSICLQLDTIPLPNSLRYLEFNDYPLKSLYSLPAGLVELHLQRSKIELLWGGMKIFEYLKCINMDGSSDLIISPNLSGVPNLEELILVGCSNLRKLHPSIGKLKKLRLLDLKGCQELTGLPDKFEMESLVTLNLTNCLKVKKIPNTICSLTSLNNLGLSGCSKLDKLPEDLGNIISLKKLDLSRTAIKELPSSVVFLIGLTSLHLRDCKKFDKLPKDLGNIVSLEILDLSGTAITELPSSIEFLIDLTALYLKDCKEFVLLPSTICSLKSLWTMDLSGCPKFVNLPENLGNLEHLNWLLVEDTAIEEFPSSVGRLAALKYLNAKDCKNLVCLPSTICNLKKVEYLDLTGCSKIANLPENMGNMESLKFLILGETAIRELPSSTIHLKQVRRVFFKGCQLSSSSLTSMPRCDSVDLSDCNLSAIPSGIDCNSMTELVLSANDFVSLPESISQFSGLRNLYLDGCKSLRSLPNIPSEVGFICVDDCTSLETLPEIPNDFSHPFFHVRCFNCFKLADNIQNFSNMFQVQCSQLIMQSYVIPGREIPKWFKEVNICDTSVVPRYFSHVEPYGMTDDIIKRVKIQLPGSGCDEWWGIVWCVVFLPAECHHRCKYGNSIGVDGYSVTCSRHTRYHGMVELKSENWGRSSVSYVTSEYGKVESHHLFLWSESKEFLPRPKTSGCSIDKKGFHQVELEIETEGLEVEEIGFRVI